MSLIMNWKGDLIDPFNLLEQDFDNAGLQVAITLSRGLRFWNQTKISYPIASHCLSMCEYFEGDLELQKIALSHEIFEAMGLGDIPTPIKALLPQVKEAENRALQTFAKVYGLNYDLFHCEEVKRADKGLMVMEALALMPKVSDYDWIAKHGQPLGELYKLGAKEDEIRSDFLKKWQEVFGRL